MELDEKKIDELNELIDDLAIIVVKLKTTATLLEELTDEFGDKITDIFGYHFNLSDVDSLQQ